LCFSEACRLGWNYRQAVQWPMAFGSYPPRICPMLGLVRRPDLSVPLIS
jgi:hypothetical protein